MKTPSVASEAFIPPDWSGSPEEALEKLRQYAERRIDAELTWYYTRKKGRAQASRFLRFGAIGFTIIGGLVPVLVSVFMRRPDWLTGFTTIRFSQLGYLFLALAGGFYGLDKFFGFSTGWMRYIVAMMAIEKVREQFRIDWSALLRSLTSLPKTDPGRVDLIEKMIQRIRTVIVEVKEHSERETQAWIQEFQSNLSQFEKDLKAQTDAAKPGGVDVEVTDGRDADGPVELLLDNMVADRFIGTAGSIGFVAPGLHRVTARARKAAHDVSASAFVTVVGGQVCQLKLTLGLKGH